VENRWSGVKGGPIDMDDAIRTERLTKYYGDRKVVDNLDLRVPRGSVYGLLGRNGAGKSTTLKMLTGMVRPDYGGIELLGDNAENLTPQMRGRIVYRIHRTTLRQTLLPSDNFAGLHLFLHL
jgi:ABC-type multidrug transport system ATPase subunit